MLQTRRWTYPMVVNNLLELLTVVLLQVLEVCIFFGTNNATCCCCCSSYFCCSYCCYGYYFLGLNFCAQTRCDKNAACFNQPSRFTFTCLCSTGYQGDGFQCVRTIREVEHKCKYEYYVHLSLVIPHRSCRSHEVLCEFTIRYKCII